MEGKFSAILTLATAVAALTALFSCSSSEHKTEVTLPNGISCRSETSGSFWHESRNLSCTDSNGKVIGSYKSDQVADFPTNQVNGQGELQKTRHQSSGHAQLTQ